VAQALSKNSSQVLSRFIIQVSSLPFCNVPFGSQGWCHFTEFLLQRTGKVLLLHLQERAPNTVMRSL
jgi:hypothetical protein